MAALRKFDSTLYEIEKSCAVILTPPLILHIRHKKSSAKLILVFVQTFTLIILGGMTNLVVIIP